MIIYYMIFAIAIFINVIKDLRNISAKNRIYLYLVIRMEYLQSLCS